MPKTLTTAAHRPTRLNAGTGETLARSYVHGATYIDELAVMRDHAGATGDHYYLLQELYSVVGLADAAGSPDDNLKTMR